MSIAIYPKSWADTLKDRAGHKYQPCNGSEGECFISAWCGKCQRDLPMSTGKDFDICGDDEVCDILARSMGFRIEEPEYPTEWQYGEDGQPKCTAFVPLGDPLPPTRCDKTIDMFGEPT